MENRSMYQEMSNSDGQPYPSAEGPLIQLKNRGEHQDTRQLLCSTEQAGQETAYSCLRKFNIFSDSIFG